MSNISVSINKFEDELNLPKGYFNNLLAEDDWSFIIKLSALLEAVTTNILIDKIDKKLENSISYMDYANPKNGRIKFLKDFGVLELEQYKILFDFASLRNQIVHKIENVTFSFDNYILSFDQNQKKKFVELYGHGVKDPIVIKDTTISRNDFVLENAKMAIWITIGEIIACIYLDKELEQYKKQLTFTISPK